MALFRTQLFDGELVVRVHADLGAIRIASSAIWRASSVRVLARARAAARA
jgi:hypothetical protein